ncbi:MAG: thioredoxin domain-containing protein [Gemmatimonadaceae bacterium]
MNRLSNETSPYLLQHATNPVDWYPWGPEALERARAEDKPILLSIGYAACHWCHVMEHESFEDERTAALMNELYVSIKVDREERPDLDGIYMQAVQAMTGHGGWPMTVFLTPAGEPFYGGTYFPPEERQGMPSFRRVLTSVHDAYRNKRDAVTSTAAKLKEIYDAALQPARASEGPDARTLERAYRSLSQTYDATHAGFGGAPKFPPSMSLDFLLRYAARTATEFARDIALNSFLAMARGGIYDQVGGGLHRYSVDAEWLVPHFEKMLYDNALFARLGVHLWQVTGDPDVRQATEATLEWVAREMTSPLGGFYSSLDADSEGHEGKFYVWDAPDLRRLLGSDADLLSEYWGASDAGNFEGRNILHVATDPSAVARRHELSLATLRQVVARARGVLYADRTQRVRPALDDKIIASWNGLMLRAVAEAARVFGDHAWRELAIRNGEFLRRHMVRDGAVLRSFKHTDPAAGVASAFGFLEDHAAVALGFLDLHALTLDAQWLAEAMAIADSVVARFYDAERGCFFDTADDHEQLITRPRDITDNAMPSGTSLAADLLLRLAVITGEARSLQLATAAVSAVAEPMGRYPSAFGHLLGVADMLVCGAVEVAIVGDRSAGAFADLQKTLGATYLPSLVVAGGEPAPDSPLALLRGRTAPAGGATAYLCRNHACDAPTSDPEHFARQLTEALNPASA